MVNKQKLKSAIRVVSLELKVPKESRQRWLELSRQCQQVVNCIWRTWLLWHVQHGTEQKQREFLAARDAWKASGSKPADKPKPPGKAVPPECGKALYAELRRRFPEVHIRVTELLRNSVSGKIGELKAAHGSLPGWVAILFCNQSLPSTVRGNPIPFDSANSELEPPADKDGEWKLHVRLTAVPRKGKMATSILETIPLWTKGRKLNSQRQLLSRIVTGEYKFCGSNVVFDDGKWFAKICYQMPVTPAIGLNADRVAFLRPANSHPWAMRLPGRNRWPGGSGMYVVAKRKQIIGERKSRQHNYRWAGSANKGHGRDRALLPIWGLQSAWKRFVKTANYTVARDVVTQCVAAGVGKLIYFQPDENSGRSRFLVWAGQVPHSKSGWDWAQMATRLGHLCHEFGVELVIRKRRETPDKPEGLQALPG